jgi:hypothetical protein
MKKGVRFEIYGKKLRNGPTESLWRGQTDVSRLVNNVKPIFHWAAMLLMDDMAPAVIDRW